GRMAALPQHGGGSWSSVFRCVNLRRDFRELLSRTARAFHLDCYIDGGGEVRFPPLRVAGSKDLWRIRRDCSFSITALTATSKLWPMRWLMARAPWTACRSASSACLS